MPTFLERFDIRVSVAYCIAASLWIIGSDKLVNLLFGGNTTLSTNLSILKGLGFVAVTTLVLFGVLFTELRKRKTIEQALRANEEQQRVILQSAMDGFWLIDAQGRFLTVNDAYCQMVGYRQNELLTMRISDVEVVETQGDIVRHIQCIKERGTDRFETRHRRKDGQVIDVEVSVTFMPELNRMSVFLRDITERKRAEMALRESEQHIRQLIAESPLATIVTAGADEHVVLMNQRFTNLFGYTQEDIPGVAQWWALAYPDAAYRDAIKAEWAAKVREAVQTRSRIEPMETDVHCKDDSIRAIEFHHSVIGGQNLIIFVDVTERRQAEEAMLARDRLQVALDKEKELNELKTRFVSLVSHEFRTPLASIQLSGDLLRRYYGKMSEAQRSERLSTIQTEVQQLVRLLDEVLTLSRIERGKLAFNPQLLDIRAFCQGLIEPLQAAHNTHRIVFSMAGECDQPQLDGELVYHILSNLLTNAVKYSPSGSMVFLDVSCRPDEAVFKVRDSGIGIPTADQAHIFEPFHRAANVGQIQGSGLGLSIVKQMTERHGGTISFDSTVGLGTTFTVAIPTHLPFENPDDNSAAY